MQSVRETSIEREMKEKGRLTYTNVGVSMWPFIRQGKDLVVIEAPKGRLKKYDVPLYRINPSENRYTLHRILEVREQDYIIRGDNCLKTEHGIRDEQIVGVLTKIIRGADKRGGGKDRKGTFRGYGRVINADNRMYLFCVRLWRFLYPIRALMLIVRRRLGKLRRLLLKSGH